MVDRFHIEKRDFLRMSVETPVTFTIKGEGNIAHIGISQDFSATGLYMVSDFAPAIGNEIEFEMKPSNERLTPFVAKAIILSCIRDEDNINTFHIKAEILQT